MLSNILSLTLDELKNALSKLYSVLIFISKRERSWCNLFPRSAYISFYYASFKEFLLDKTRLREYWYKNHCHYTVLATKVLCLFKDLYMINGSSCGTSSMPNNILLWMQLVDKRIPKLQELLPVFLDRTFISSESLMF